MEIIVTLPPPHLKSMREVAANPNIDFFRVNTGVKTPYSPKEMLQKILEHVPKEKLWIDIKGRQLRIEMWAVYPLGDIMLNRDVKVDLPAKIYFRNDEVSTIVEIQGRKIFVDPGPKYYVGAGQAVNIIGHNFEVVGDYLTDTCKRYIEAGSELGIHKYMLSFLEKPSDVAEVLAIDPDAEICGKIESLPGLELIKNDCYLFEKNANVRPNIRLMAARDDLFINIGTDKKKIFEALKLIIRQDPKAIAASRILTSLEKGDHDLALSDLSDIYLLKEMGYTSLLLSDGLSSNPAILRQAVSILRTF